MTRIAISPQNLLIGAPQHIVLDVMSTVGYQCTPGSGRSVHLLSRQTKGVIAAFVERDSNVQTLTIKRVIPLPPDRVTYEHLSGPFAGAVEEIILKSVGGGTDLSLAAEFEPKHDHAPRVLKFMFETSALEHIEEVRNGAESRAREMGFTSDHSFSRVPTPEVSTEAELIELAMVQEQAEWGHIGHGRGVARVASYFSKELGLDARSGDEIERAALLHDVGKIGLTASLWGELGVLPPEQRAILEAHPRLGAELAQRVGLPDSITVAILHHHEHWNGQGYPQGLTGENISVHGRILCLAENIDAMMRSTYRREPVELDKMLGMIEDGAGREWDPRLVTLVAPIIRGRKW
jgi:putative nucleotidyltransferase with HDIG domain